MKYPGLSLAVLSLVASVAVAQVDAPRISQPDFKKLVASNNVLIVDTRNVDAYEISHIPGAVLLPLEGLMTWPAEYEKVAQTIQKSRKPVVTYCA
jgi:rhodanese-related sulfurtransferase